MDDEVLLSAELFLAGLLIGVVVFIAWVVLRRTLITRHHDIMLMAVRKREVWAMGLARSDEERVCWFPVLGVSLRPRHVWRRHEMELGSPHPGDDVPQVISDPVVVKCATGDDAFDLALSRGDHTRLRSWTESAPPGRNLRLYE